MKSDKKTLYIVIAFVCILVVSIIVTVKNKGFTLLASADNQSSSFLAEKSSSDTEQKTDINFGYYVTEDVDEKLPEKEKETNIHTTTKTTTTGKNSVVDSKPSTIKADTTTTTSKKSTITKPSSSTSTIQKPSTEASTKITNEILYYYTDGTTGYTPKPGAKYYDNYCWQFVPGNTVTDEEIKEAHKKCQYCGREDCIRFWISEQECPDCGVLVPVDVCHHCS